MSPKSAIPRLRFLPAEWTGDAVKVEEINLEVGSASPPPFKASRWVVSPGKASEVDAHDVRECWFIASGTGQLIYNDSVRGQVEAGDVLYFESRHPHQLLNNGVTPLMVYSVWWDANA